jgi:Transposase domain (DUF772)
MYAEVGRPSIPPERLLKSMLLMALYSVRSERQFCEQLDYNLLFRWVFKEGVGLVCCPLGWLTRSCRAFAAAPTRAREHVPVSRDP